ncbi:MAG: nucleotidyl transferase AbiEii/AbiGii toxin family protein [Cytophagales bacterium]|nr:nucleotidyl transferase AbiEii/AbiGii toxin family protein [Cytophagales bacterium]
MNFTMLHTEAVEPGMMELLKGLCSINELENFALIGGTNLALRLGHRISKDLDFFSMDDFKEGETDMLIKKKYPDMIITEKDKQFRKYIINGIKAQFLRFNYPMLKEIEVKEGIRMYSLEDTIAAKMGAIVNRGTKRDFYDVYELLKTRKVDGLVGLYAKKFDDNTVTTIKALTDFQKADGEKKNPVSLNNIKWEQVKEGIVQKVNNYIKSKMESKGKSKGMEM